MIRFSLSNPTNHISFTFSLDPWFKFLFQSPPKYAYSILNYIDNVFFGNLLDN